MQYVDQHVGRTLYIQCGLGMDMCTAWLLPLYDRDDQNRDFHSLLTLENPSFCFDETSRLTMETTSDKRGPQYYSFLLLSRLQEGFVKQLSGVSSLRVLPKDEKERQDQSLEMEKLSIPPDLIFILSDFLQHLGLIDTTGTAFTIASI